MQRLVINFCLIGCLSYFFFSCDQSEELGLPENFDINVERAEQVEIFYSDSAQVKVKISGPTMLYHVSKSDPVQEFPDGVLVDFYGDNGQKTSQLTAKHGMRYERTEKVVVSDSVVWKSVLNEMIETEELIWQENIKKIFTKKFARITRPNEIIFGYGFEADQSFKNAKINAVTGRLKIEDIQKDPNQ